MAEIKIKNKKYRIGNFPDTEKYLSEQHSAGLEFLRYEKAKLFQMHGYFVFKKCEAQECIYKFDYQDKIDDENAYFELFKDCDWDYAGKYDLFHVFRKPKSENKNNDIFSDNKSKSEMCKKVLASRTTVTLLIFLFLMVYLLFFNDIFNYGDTLNFYYISTLLLNFIFCIFMITLAIYSIFNLQNILDLERIIKKYQNPLDFDKNK